MENLLFCLILFSVLVQGGYFPTVYLIAAVVLAAAGFFQKRRVLPVPEGVLWGFAAVYLCASLAAGYSSESLAQACLPSACALFLSRYIGLSRERKRHLLDKTIAAAALLAGAAVLTFCGVFPLTGAVTSNRLQFTFQYANAAGIWFAAVSLLAQERDRPEIRCMAIPSITALMLTRSVGALGVYGLAQAARLWRGRKKPEIWQETVLAHAMAGGFALAFYALDGWIVIPVLALLYAGCRYGQRFYKTAVRFRLHWVVLAAGCGGMVAALFSRRVSSSLMTFAERLSQIKDGAAVIAAYPLTGVGAGNWAYLYPFYQSAQYTSTVVHSGVIQIGVDSGIAAAAAAIAFFVLAWRRGGAGRGEKLAALMIAVHSTVDFTLQFFSIDVLLLALLFSGEAPKEKEAGRWVPVCLSVAAGLLCGVMLWTELATKEMVRNVHDGHWETALELYERRKPLFGQSGAARECLVYSLYYTDQWARVVETARSAEALSTQELLLEAQALRALGDQNGACELLLDQMEQQIYHVILFEQTRQRLLEWGAAERYLEDYDRIVDRANASQSTLGALQGDQIYIDHIRKRQEEKS